MKRLYEVLYRVGITPWDSARIPAPLAAEVRAAAPAIAVDLGCGTGTQARHLAANGWTVTAVDCGQSRPNDLGATPSAQPAPTIGNSRNF
jgi:trans-aconitate methyltransferase